MGSSATKDVTREVDVPADRTDQTTAPLPAVPEEAPLEVAPPDGPPVPPQTRRQVPRTVWFFVVVAVLIVAMGLATSFVIRALGDANPFKNGFVTQRTVDRSGPAVLKAVNDLGRFQAAGGYYEVVIDVEHSTDNVPSIISGNRTLFVAAGNVDVSVDLASLGSGAVSSRSRRSARPVVPCAPIPPPCP